MRTSRKIEVEYQITWQIELEADNVKEAVLLALQIQRDPNSMATHFHVRDPMGEQIEVDLLNRSLD